MDDPVFIFDIDDTLIHTDPIFWDLAYALTGIKITEEQRLTRKKTHLADCELGYSVEDEKRVLKMMDVMKCWERMDFFSEAKMFIRKLEAARYRINYVTARDVSIMGQTYQNFKDNNIYMDVHQLHMNSHCDEKFENLQKVVEKYRKNCPGSEIYYFEDHPKYLGHAVELGIDHVVTFDTNFIRHSSEFNIEDVEIFPNQNLCFYEMRQRIFSNNG